MFNFVANFPRIRRFFDKVSDKVSDKVLDKVPGPGGGDISRALDVEWHSGEVGLE